MRSTHDELDALWQRLQEIDHRGATILLDPKSYDDLRRDDRSIYDGSFRPDRADKWRDLPVTVRKFRPTLSASTKAPENAPVYAPWPPREIVIEYRDRATERWAYLDATGDRA